MRIEFSRLRTFGYHRQSPPRNWRWARQISGVVWPEDLKLVASPISSRIRAAVLTPMPGIEVRTPARVVRIEYHLNLGGDLFAPTLRRDLPRRRQCPYQRSFDATKPGDTTPRIMGSTGGVRHAGPGDHDSLIRSYEEGTGALLTGR